MDLKKSEDFEIKLDLAYFLEGKIESLQSIIEQYERLIEDADTYDEQQRIRRRIFICKEEIKFLDSFLLDLPHM